MTKHLIALAILLCTVACSSPKEKHEQKTGEPLNIGQYLGRASRICIAENYLVVMDNQADTKLTLFNLNESTLKPTYTGYAGNGPHELGKAGTIIVEAKGFSVFDGADRSLLSYRLDSIDMENYKPLRTSLELETDIIDAANIGNGKLVTTGIFPDKRFYIYNAQGALVSKLGEYPIEVEENVPAYVKSIACLSLLTSLPSKNRFAAAMTYGEHIQFYELTDSKDLKLINEHQAFLPEYEVVHQNFQPTPSTRWAYLSVCSNSDYVYALYSGKYQKPDIEFYKGNIIHVFDWGGNRVNTIELDKNVTRIASTEEYLFALYENENGYEIDKYEL